ncbi:hypothetical protein ACYJ1Y_16070 [Natrialbaceae archaeon A-gly3]
MTPPIDWPGLLEDARGWLGLEEGEPVPLEELVEQAKAVGYSEREARRALRETDVVVPAGKNLESGVILDEGHEKTVLSEPTDETSCGDSPPTSGTGAADAPEEETGAGGEEPTTGDATEQDESTDENEITGSWFTIGFSDIEPGTYPPELLSREQWMGRAGESGKQPFAPWADRDHPDADPDEDARWKWGLEENYVDGETIAIAEDDPRLDGRVFIQRESDPYAFVDGDDVRCPETGDVHPTFAAILEQLGVTYADVSTSGAGVHAYYKGELPIDGKGQATFEIDTEPWGANESPPAVEIYANKHVNVATGEHIRETPLEVTEWDHDTLRTILQANGYQDEQDIRHDTDRDREDLKDHTPSATESDETTHDVRDVLKAVDRLEPSDVPVTTSKTGEDSTGWTTWDPSYRSSESGSSLHYNGEGVFYDHKEGEEFGVLGLFAAEQNIISNPWDRLEGERWWKAVEEARERGAGIPKYVPESEDDETDGRDPLGPEVVIEPEDAWRAARAVTAEHLEKPIVGLEVGDDGRWTTPAGDTLDIIDAVAYAEGLVDEPGAPPTDATYTHAYELARERYGAPLPKYLDATALESRANYIFGAVEALKPVHLLEGARSEVTVEDPAGAAIAKLDPVWEESESGERILVFDSVFWCAKHETTIYPLEFVALEYGLVTEEGERPTGEAFKQAYRAAREEYGANLPRWTATLLEHVAVLPPAVRLVDGASAEVSVRTLEEARDDVEDLLRDAGTVTDRAQLVTCLPALGKTFSAVKAAEENPTVYLAGRNELKEQAEDYAKENDVSYYHLPILAENQISEAALLEAVGAIRDWGRGMLERFANGNLEKIDTPIDPEEEHDDENTDEESATVERATCPTAEGEHGDGWRVAVQTARALGFKASEIHERAPELFGQELPCQEDGDCEYTLGWERVTNPDAPVDLLIGGHGHAYVDGATTYIYREEKQVRTKPRTVVIDEFPDDQYSSEYGENWTRFATWAAKCLTDVADVEELLERREEMREETWVNAWLAGEGDDLSSVAGVIAQLRGAARAVDAIHSTEEVLEDAEVLEQEVDALEGLTDTLEALCELPESLPVAEVADARDALQAARDDAESLAAQAYGGAGDRLGVAPEAIYTVVNRIDDDVLEPLSESLAKATDIAYSGEIGSNAAGYDSLDVEFAPETVNEEMPIYSDLQDLVESAIDAARNRRDATGLVKAAAVALEGGRDGCRELALFSNWGYSHPSAHHLLAGLIATTDDPDVTEVSTDQFGFDVHAPDGGTNLKVLERKGATILADRNHHGAIVHNPPAFTDAAGAKCPLVGLDATARPELWRIAIGRGAEIRDIHQTPTERRRFLKERMNTVVVQTSDHVNTYGGDPEHKNFGEDLALLDEAVEEYGEKPGVITTKKARGYLGDELEERASAVDHFGNVTGSDAFGDVSTGAILGVQHFGDEEVEKWAALAGEEVERSGHGNTLDYGTPIANTYRDHMLKDQTMQAILRFGRSDEETIVLAHTSSLRDDLPVVGDGVTVTAHSKATLEVAEAARELKGTRFTSSDVHEAIDEAFTSRTVRNVLANLTEMGCLSRESGGRSHEYTLEEDPGTGDAALPGLEITGDAEKSSIEDNYTWNFREGRESSLDEGSEVTSGPVIPAPSRGDPTGSGVTPPS